MQHEQSKTCDCIISDGHKTTSKKQERIILVLEKKKEEKEHISVQERQLAFRVHLSMKEIDLC